MKSPFYLLGACALFSLCSLASESGQRMVLTGNANLRAKPSMNAEILASLKKGDAFMASPRKVSAVQATSDEPTEWVEVSAPASARVWIAAGLVDAATRKVKVDRAHLRAGPGTNFAEVGHVPKGTVLDVANRLEGWIRIAAPPGAVVGYVAANLARPEAGDVPAAPVAEPPAKASASPSAPPTARMTPPPGNRPPSPPPLTLSSRSGPTPLPPNGSRPVVGAGRVVPPGATVAGRPLVMPPPLPAAQPPGNAATLATAPAAPPLPVPAPGLSQPTEVSRPSPVAPPAVPVEPTAAVAEPTIPPPAESGRQAEIVFMNEKPRQVVRQGVVALAVSPQAPGRYQLDSFRRGEGSLGFLISDDATLDFEKWRAKQVVIQGEEYRDARWQTRSVIKVKSIEAAP